MTKIKFGTDGWRAIIAREYTELNVMRVAEGTAKWILQKGKPEVSAVIGYDCRFGGEMFMKATARILASFGIKCIVDEKFISTPMVSLATLTYGAQAGIVITASHNPPSYNGFKIKDSFGGPAVPEEIAKVESFIPESLSKEPESFEFYVSQGIIEFRDMEQLYLDAIEKGIDFNAIRKSGFEMAYDAMYGAGQSAMRRLLEEATFLHCEFNPSFDGQAPEPIHKNLGELSELIQISEDIDIGLATDGDADRIGLYNSSGKFIDSHHIILLLIRYLHAVKGLSGKVVNSFSCTGKISKLCEHYGLEQEITKIGFKYICDTIVNEDVLVGGEESGGIAIKGHIPERDGLWIGLTILEYMSVTGKTLDELIEEVYAITGPFAVERYDLHIDEALKQKVIKMCSEQKFDLPAPFNITGSSDLDGYKYYLSNDQWVMIRPSGTEPVLRVYAESDTSENAFKILETVKGIIMSLR
ncbi:MAG: phosphoglucomutase/phosphomannomutase family protein [Flavobacteriales bacterium]|nr:phosphoglucomutase/phosphomannomutase family protein [Flavobacteriales bacterium]